MYRSLVALVIAMLVAGCFSDEPPPCSPEEGGVYGPGGPVHGPTEPGPTSPPLPPDGAEPEYRKNAEGEVCLCGPRELGCTADPSGEAPRTGGAEGLPPLGNGQVDVSGGPPATDEAGLCGTTYYCCADVTCPRVENAFQITNYPICPLAHGEHESVHGAIRAWGKQVDAARGRLCAVQRLNCMASPIADIAECGLSKVYAP